MSGASTSYDPKQVAALAPEALQDGVTAARQAFTEAADLDQLKAAPDFKYTSTAVAASNMRPTAEQPMKKTTP